MLDVDAKLKGALARTKIPKLNFPKEVS